MEEDSLIQNNCGALRILRLAKFAGLFASFTAHAFGLTSANFAEAGEPILDMRRTRKLWMFPMHQQGRHISASCSMLLTAIPGDVPLIVKIQMVSFVILHCLLS